jgi:hypothetical protein
MLRRSYRGQTEGRSCGKKSFLCANKEDSGLFKRVPSLGFHISGLRAGDRQNVLPLRNRSEADGKNGCGQLRLPRTEVGLMRKNVAFLVWDKTCVKFHDEMKPLLLRLRDHFTQILEAQQRECDEDVRTDTILESAR